MSEIKYSMSAVTKRRKREPKKQKSRYDPIIDQFLEGTHNLVEINVPGKGGSYIKSLLDKRVKRRSLDITVSSVGDYVYLERPKKKPPT